MFSNSDNYNGKSVSSSLVKYLLSLLFQLLPLAAGPLLMFMEEFPFIRKLDFLFNNQIKELQEIIDKMNGIVKDVR